MVSWPRSGSCRRHEPKVFSGYREGSDFALKEEGPAVRSVVPWRNHRGGRERLDEGRGGGTAVALSLRSVGRLSYSAAPYSQRSSPALRAWTVWVASATVQKSPVPANAALTVRRG